MDDVRGCHDRRRFLTGAAGAAAASLTGTRALGAERTIKAVAFDAFPIFDLRAVVAKTRQRLPERGDGLRDLWLQKLFAYTWLRTTARQYAPFTDVLAQSLDYAASATGVSLTAADRDELLGVFWTLPIWPDVKDQLGRLRNQGIRLVFLSNMSEPMMRANMNLNGIEPLFEAVLSTDRVHAFKPAPEAYALGPRALRLRKEEIAFAAFAGWDAAGASWFGYPTAWVNRLAQPPEVVDAPRVATGRDLTILAELVRSRAS
jgi:2-haloacid dehalogenase